jgi:nitrogen fixation NifU-like protein
VHSAQLLEHFRSPRNTGELESPAITVEVTNPACGDILRLSARIEDGRIAEVRYKVRGCTASIGAGSALTECLLEAPPGEWHKLSAETLEERLGGLAPATRHALTLCLDAVRALHAASRG